MSRDNPTTNDDFYAMRALKRAKELEERSDPHPSAMQAKLANFAGWMVEDDAIPLNVLSELGRIEDEETFWEAVDWYFEKADHLHPLKLTTEEEIAEHIRRMREGGRPLP